MPAPLDPVVREKIAADIREGGWSRNEIARAHGVSAGMVTKIGRQLEAASELETPAFDRGPTAAATAARVVDLAAQRVALAEQALDDARLIRARMWEPQTVMVGKGDDAYPIQVPPAARDFKDHAIAFGIMVDKSRALEAGEADPAQAGKSAVLSLVDELRQRRAAREVG